VANGPVTVTCVVSVLVVIELVTPQRVEVVLPERLERFAERAAELDELVIGPSPSRRWVHDFRWALRPIQGGPGEDATAG
jgi:hypothetical protein